MESWLKLPQGSLLISLRFCRCPLLLAADLVWETAACTMHYIVFAHVPEPRLLRRNVVSLFLDISIAQPFLVEFWFGTDVFRVEPFNALAYECFPGWSDMCLQVSGP